MPDVHGEDPRPTADRPARTSSASAARAVTTLVLAVLLVLGVVSSGYLVDRKANPTADPLNPAAGPVPVGGHDRLQGGS